MDMTPIQWILIVLLVLLIAVGVYMLTRKPTAQGGTDTSVDEAPTYGVEGEHAPVEPAPVSDGGVTPNAPLYDQEADAAPLQSSVDEEPIDAPVWSGNDDAVGQDTATGGEVDIVEEEPRTAAPEDGENLHESPSSPAFADGGDRDQMSYGDPQTEDFASETVYADAPADTFVAEERTITDGENEDAGDDVPDTAAAAGFAGAAGATAMADDPDASSEPTAYDDHTGHPHNQPVIENVGPADQSEPWTQGHPEQGHPGGNSQPGDDATYAAPDTHGEGAENLGPDEGEGDSVSADAELGHPGPSSQQGDEATYDVGAAGAVAAATHDGDRDTTGDEVVVDEPAFTATHDAPVEVIEPDVTFVDSAPTDDAAHNDVPEEIVVEEVVVVDEPDNNEFVADESTFTATDDAPHDAPVEVIEPDVTFVDSAPTGDAATHDGPDETAHNDVPEAIVVEEVVVVDEPDNDEFVTDEPTVTATDDAPHDVEAEDTAYVPVAAEDESATEAPFEEPVNESDPRIEDSPYGVGSALPDDDAQGPDGYDIKGNAGSMLFHTPESPSYGECTPEVFFETEDAARAAGFAHWDRKRR